MFQQKISHSYSNIGLAASGRAFPGFPKKSEVSEFTIRSRDALRIDLLADDLLSVCDLPESEGLDLLVFDEKGRLDPERVGLSPSQPVRSRDFDCEPLSGWVTANGGIVQEEYEAAQVISDGDIIVLKARADCHVWVVRAMTAETLVSGQVKGEVTLTHKPAASGVRSLLPPLLGDVRDEFTIHRGTASAYELRAGEVVQIIDVEGQQCSDFTAFRMSPLERGEELMLDTTATRTMVRGSYPAPGLFDKFYDRDMRPILNVVQDTCGRHDAFGMACTARGYEEIGFLAHLNCSDNISHAAAPFGVKPRLAWPAINFFWNTWIDENSHHLLTEESYSRPNDYIAMRAMDDLVCVSTACPDDIDPINGWNPTDVHVRIYKPETLIRRAVAYREKENAPMSLSTESAFQKRTELMTSNFAPSRDLWAPVSFPSVGTTGEYWACRKNVTLQDMSGLRKYDIVGPDAERLLQKAMTRDIAKLATWRGTYALMCDDTGAVIDDGTLFRLAPELFRWCCGSEESARVLKELAQLENLQVCVRDLGNTLPNLALQGPNSRDLLRKVVFTQPTVPSLDQVKWFGVTVARLNDREGVPFMLARAGYTGELGYELFCARSDALELWDALMEAGEEFGIQPMGSAALETIRIEAGLAAANAEFASGVDAFEAGLGFAVDLRKSEFVGKAALERNAADQRRVLKGVLLNCDDVPTHGAPVLIGERQVGTVTSATRSPLLERSIAMVRLAVEHSNEGTEVNIGMMDGHMKRLPATVVSVPFVDPTRKRARA